MAYTVTDNPWKSQYPITTGTETVTGQLNVQGVPDGNNITLYLNHGSYNNMIFQHLSGTVALTVNGANSMLFGTDGVEKMRLTHTTGNLGIGTTAPDQKLHVMKASAGSIDSDSNSVLTIENDDTAVLQILCPEANNGYILMGNPNDGAADGRIRYNNSTREMSLWTSATERFTIQADGDVGIGDTSPSYKLEVNGTFYSSGSSMDYKQEVQDYKPDADAIMNLRPVNYEYTDEYKHFGKRLENNSPQIGLVAEEVAEVMPELAVMKEEDGKDVVRNVDYEKLTVVLLSAVQELKREVKALKEEN